MYAAGYTGESTYHSKVSAQTWDDASAEVAFLPVLDSLKGPKSKLLVNNLSERYLFPQKSLENGKCFIFHTPDNALAPHIKEGDMVIFDLKKTPSDGDIVLFRIRKEEGLVRYYRKVNSKLIAYATSPEFPPDYFSKNDVEVLGVAVKAILNL